MKMEDLINSIKIFFELNEIDLNARFADFEEWDSLSVLSVLALLDSDYGLNMTQKEVESFPSIAAFVDYVEKNAK
jgi:acyl carrier protein